MNQLIYTLERINLTGYVEYLDSKKKLLWNSFLIGVARGLGSAIGFSLLGALVVFIFVETGLINMPAIQQYLGNIMKNALPK